MNFSSGSIKFYCVGCEITFSCVDEKGKAVCPKCKCSRGDNFNQISKNSLRCVACSCLFTYGYVIGEKIRCPNNCI